MDVHNFRLEISEFSLHCEVIYGKAVPRAFYYDTSLTLKTPNTENSCHHLLYRQYFDHDYLVISNTDFNLVPLEPNAIPRHVTPTG